MARWWHDTGTTKRASLIIFSSRRTPHSSAHQAFWQDRSGHVLGRHLLQPIALEAKGPNRSRREAVINPLRCANSPPAANQDYSLHALGAKSRRGDELRSVLGMAQAGSCEKRWRFEPVTCGESRGFRSQLQPSATRLGRQEDEPIAQAVITDGESLSHPFPINHGAFGESPPKKFFTLKAIDADCINDMTREQRLKAFAKTEAKDVVWPEPDSDVDAVKLLIDPNHRAQKLTRPRMGHNEVAIDSSRSRQVPHSRKTIPDHDCAPEYARGAPVTIPMAQSR